MRAAQVSAQARKKVFGYETIPERSHVTASIGDSVTSHQIYRHLPLWSYNVFACDRATLRTTLRTTLP